MRYLHNVFWVGNSRKIIPHSRYYMACTFNEKAKLLGIEKVALASLHARVVRLPDSHLGHHRSF